MIDSLKNILGSKSNTTTQNIIVSIDGVDGAGKSTFAQRMTAQFGGSILAVDDYLVPHHGTYLPWIKYRQLKLDYEKTKQKDTALIVFEGICILAVLERLKLTPDVRVYLRRLDAIGAWQDKELCSEHDHLEDKLIWQEQLEKHTRVMSYAREIAQYHIQYKPISNADFVINTPLA